MQDKSIIDSLNRNQLYFVDDGYRFYDYIENGILKTRKINNDVNWKHIEGINRNNKKDYIYSAGYVSIKVKVIAIIDRGMKK